MQFTQIQPFLQAVSSKLPEVILIRAQLEEDTCAIIKRILTLPPINNKLVSKRLDAEELALPELQELLEPHVLFGEPPLVILKQIDKLKSSCSSFLKEWVKRNAFPSLWILTSSGESKESGIFKLLEPKAHALNLSSEKEREKKERLLGWAIGRVQAEGKSMAPQASQMLSEIVPDLTALDNEIEKLLCYSEERRQITLADVETLLVCNKTVTIWQWEEALFKREWKKALGDGFSLLKEGQPFVAILKHFRGQVQTKFQVWSLLNQGGGLAAVQELFPYMKGRILEQNCQLVSSYQFSLWKQMIQVIEEMDLLARGSNQEDACLMDLLIAKLGALWIQKN